MAESIFVNRDKSTDSSMYPVTVMEAVYHSDGRTIFQYLTDSSTLIIQDADSGEIKIYVAGVSKADFVADYVFNVCLYNKTTSYSDSTAARNAVPTSFRKLGLIVVYKISSVWHTDIFNGSNVSEWGDSTKWVEFVRRDEITTVQSRLNVIDASITSINSYLANIDSSIIRLDASKADIDGTYDDLVCGNLSSWTQRGELEVIDEWSDVVRTTAGSISINSNKPAYILHVESKNSFTASALTASGINLLNPSVKIGNSYVFVVPKMVKGGYGLADTANGILFVDVNGNNLNPTVRFSSTYPTSDSSGTAVTPYQFSGHSEYFYPASTYGYFIVSGLSSSNVCARIAWSKDYNVYVPYTAPSSVSLTTTVNTIASPHSSVVNKMLAVGNICDEATFDGTNNEVNWIRRVSAVLPTWTDTQVDASNWLHTADIPSTYGAMKSGGAAELLSSGLSLTSEINTVSYTDDSSTSSAGAIVKYELAVVASGSFSQTNSYQPNDLGVECLVDCSGGFMIRTSYFQGIPDMVYSLINKVDVLQGDVDSISIDNLGDAHAKSIDLDELPKVCGYSFYLFGTAAPAVIPDFIGQMYIDTTNKNIYMSAGVSSSSDFKKLN